MFSMAMSSVIGGIVFQLRDRYGASRFSLILTSLRCRGEAYFCSTLSNSSPTAKRESPAASNNARSPGSHNLVRVKYAASVSSSPMDGCFSSHHQAHGRVPGAPRKNSQGVVFGNSEEYLPLIQNASSASRWAVQSARMTSSMNAQVLTGSIAIAVVPAHGV